MKTCFKPPCCLICGKDLVMTAAPHIRPPTLNHVHLHPLPLQLLCKLKCLQQEKLRKAHLKIPGEAVSRILTAGARQQHSNFCSKPAREYEFAKTPHFPGQPSVYWVTSIQYILTSLIFAAWKARLSLMINVKANLQLWWGKTRLLRSCSARIWG